MSKTFFFSLIHFVKLPCFHVVPLFPIIFGPDFCGFVFIFFMGFRIFSSI